MNMVLLLKTGILFLCFLIVPYVVGKTFFYHGSDGAVLKSHVMGCFLLATFFQIVTIPLIFLDVSLVTLVIVYYAVCVVCCLGMALIWRKRGERPIYSIKGWIHRCFHRVRQSTKTEIVFGIIFVAIVLMQIYLSVVYWHSDSDDATYVALSTTSYQTNSLYRYDAFYGYGIQSWMDPKRIVAPISLLFAVIARTYSIHPAILMHTIFPLLAIVLAYEVYILMAQKFFDKDDNAESKLVFLIALSVTLMFGGYSAWTLGMHLFIRSSQGKVLTYSIAVPFVFLQLYTIMEEKKRGKEMDVTATNQMRRTYLTTFVAAAGSTLASTMTGVLVPIIVAAYAIVALFSTRNLKFFISILLLCAPCIFMDALYLIV